MATSTATTTAEFVQMLATGLFPQLLMPIIIIASLVGFFIAFVNDDE